MASAESTGLHVNSARGLTTAQCSTLLRAYDGVKKPSLSFLWKTFDRGLGDCPKRFTERFKDKPHTLSVYLSNETCRRPPRYCEPGREIFAHTRYGPLSRLLERKDRRLLGAFSRRAGAISAYLGTVANENTELVIIYGLEDDWSNKAFRAVKAAVDPMLDTKILKVRNPNGRDAKRYSLGGADFIELHPIESNFRGKACIFSNDGVDVNLGGSYRPLRDPLSVSTMFSAIREAKRACSRTFLWWNNQGVGERFIVPSKRSYRINKNDIAVINKLLRRLEK